MTDIPSTVGIHRCPSLREGAQPHSPAQVPSSEEEAGQGNHFLRAGSSAVPRTLGGKMGSSTSDSFSKT